MRFARPRIDFLAESEIRQIVDFALRILDEIGMRIENEKMCRRLADHGAVWDQEFGVKFPKKLIEAHLAAERGREPSAQDQISSSFATPSPMSRDVRKRDGARFRVTFSQDVCCWQPKRPRPQCRKSLPHTPLSAT